MSKEQWKQLKEKEKVKKNLGKVGITKFQSRSFADWQKAGGKNLFPVDPKAIKNPKDLPYVSSNCMYMIMDHLTMNQQMMRPGGSADDVDLKKNVNPFAKLFGGKKKEEPVEEPKQQNWWTLK